MCWRENQMLQINCYLEEEAKCKGVLTSSVLVWEPLQVLSRSLEAPLLPPAWQECVHTHLCFCVCGQDARNTAPSGTALLYQSASADKALCWEQGGLCGGMIHLIPGDCCTEHGFAKAVVLVWHSLTFDEERKTPMKVTFLGKRCFTPLRCTGMVKANVNPTTVHCKDRLQSRKHESESATSSPCLRNCPTDFSGARNEKSSQWQQGQKECWTRSQAELPSMSPLLSWGWS